MKAVLFDPEKGFTEVEIIKSEEGNYLKPIYSLLDCSMIEGLYVVDDLYAFVDEEGLYKQNNKVSMVFYDKGQIVSQIVGKVLFVNSDNKGETISLTDAMIEKIKELTTAVIFYKNRPMENNFAIVIAK